MVLESSKDSDGHEQEAEDEEEEIFHSEEENDADGAIYVSPKKSFSFNDEGIIEIVDSSGTRVFLLIQPFVNKKCPIHLFYVSFCTRLFLFVFALLSLLFVNVFVTLFTQNFYHLLLNIFSKDENHSESASSSKEDSLTEPELKQLLEVYKGELTKMEVNLNKLFLCQITFSQT